MGVSPLATQAAPMLLKDLVPVSRLFRLIPEQHLTSSTDVGIRSAGSQFGKGGLDRVGVGQRTRCDVEGTANGGMETAASETV